MQTDIIEQELEGLFPAGAGIDILDFGAGPITFLGTISARNRISITATDPLADAYVSICQATGSGVNRQTTWCVSAKKKCANGFRRGRRETIQK